MIRSRKKAIRSSVSWWELLNESKENKTPKQIKYKYNLNHHRFGGTDRTDILLVFDRPVPCKQLISTARYSIFNAGCRWFNDQTCEYHCVKSPTCNIVDWINSCKAGKTLKLRFTSVILCWLVFRLSVATEKILV